MQMFFRSVKDAETMGTVTRSEINGKFPVLSQRAAQMAAHAAHDAVALREAIKYIKGRG